MKQNNSPKNSKISKQLIHKRIMLIIACIIVLGVAMKFANAENAATSQLGFFPNGTKQVISYTSQNAGSFQVINVINNATVFSGNLTIPKDSSGNNAKCQGGQSCLIGDFSSFTSSGNYYIKTSFGGSTNSFQINSNIYSSQQKLFMEFFQALMQQKSAYHVDIHKAQNPPFPMMADGSFIMEAQMVTPTLIRLGSAYRRNPAIFNFDTYTINKANTPDIKEYIESYVKYLETLQNTTGSMEIVRGWNNNFNCGFITPTTSSWNTVPDSCMTFKKDSSQLFTTSGFLAYMEAYLALDSAKQSEVLQRSIATYNFIKQNYSFGNQDEAGYTGAGLFLLYDYTSNPQYLIDAYNLRSKVPNSLSADQTAGREFYWEEYARHKNALLAANLSYNFNGEDPAMIFYQRIQSDWPAISKTAEQVFQYNNEIKFQNSRYMLGESLFGAKAADLTNAKLGRDVAESQISFITGKNQVQSGTGTGALISRSFIFGIGKNPKYFHIRLVPGPQFVDQGKTFVNGKKFIPGWINGVYDSNGDGIFNYNDNFNAWQFAETSNEMVAQEIELFAYMDIISRKNLSSNPIQTNNSGNSTNSANQTYLNIQNIPALCVGGSITSNTYDGGRHITCINGSNRLSVDGWDKPNSANPQYFEMFKSSQTGSGLQICLLTTCVGNSGYAKSPSYPLAGSSGTINTTQPPTNNTNQNNTNTTQNSTNTTVPPSEYFTNLQNIPSKCNGGNIIKDTYDGGRHIVCRTSSSNLSIDAWDKPTSSNPQYFEMYKKSQTGSGLQICLLTTCISTEGYVKSPNYPLNTSVQANSTANTTGNNTNNTSNNTNNTTSNNTSNSSNITYVNMQSIPATCSGGSITFDTYNGGRNILCMNATSNLSVTVWNKPSDTSPQYFEMYKNSGNGAALKICLLSTCISDNGYAKSPVFPIVT